MSEQLDWLARNVHEWPATAAWPSGHEVFEEGAVFKEGRLFWGAGFNQYCATHQQWLDRRAELQNKPSWADAPEWATHLVQQISGDWLWCEGVPVASKDGGWFGCFSQAASGSVLGDWRDTLERRQANLSEQASLHEATDNVPELKSDQPLSRADALRWTVENVKTWHKAPLGNWPAPYGWSWEQACGRIYLMRVGEPCIGEAVWSSAVEQSYDSVEDGLADDTAAAARIIKADVIGVDQHTPELLSTSTLHTIHHAAFLHRDCQLLLSEPELVVFRTADGELIHCKPKECLIDPDVYGLAARLLADMSGHPVAPEHMRELVEQMGWSV